MDKICCRKAGGRGGRKRVLVGPAVYRQRCTVVRLVGEVMAEVRIGWGRNYRQTVVMRDSIEILGGRRLRKIVGNK